MSVHKLDPTVDVRWPELLARHPAASIFHTPAWLGALRTTYGYQPLVFTTSDGSELSDGMVFCEIDSWLTGKRLVSLPFSDHCQPLAEGRSLKAILDFLHRSRAAERWKYIELRPVSDESMLGSQNHVSSSECFRLHSIDLRPDVELIYRGFHDNCVRRKIKRAQREKLVYECGRTAEILEKFYQLLLLTRRRHKLPPQPVAWFRSLLQSFGEDISIHLLSKEDHPIASIITVGYKKVLVYKYGCSDARFHNLGGMPLLFWNAIQQAKRLGAEEFDLGRSGYDDPGLIAFKEHLGATGSELTYYRSGGQGVQKHSSAGWARQMVSRLPDSLLTGTGRVLYRHLG
jgi:hypothetical protein